MTLVSDIAVEQGVIVAAIMIAFLYLHASDVHQHSFNRSLVTTVLYQDTDSQSRSPKLARMYDVNLVQFWNEWLMYAADNVKARIRQRV